MSEINELHKKISENSYVHLLKVLGDALILVIGGKNWDMEKASKLADLIIKIKTIQALDTSADLIRASRQVSKN